MFFNKALHRNVIGLVFCVRRTTTPKILYSHTPSTTSTICSSDKLNHLHVRQRFTSYYEVRNNKNRQNSPSQKRQVLNIVGIAWDSEKIKKMIEFLVISDLQNIKSECFQKEYGTPSDKYCRRRYRIEWHVIRHTSFTWILKLQWYAVWYPKWIGPCVPNSLACHKKKDLSRSVIYYYGTLRLRLYICL